jgi:hypothetical protein
MTLEQAIELVKGPFGAVVRQTAISYVAPLFWESSEQGTKENIMNGSLFFLDCGEGPFGVTACHVIDEYIKIKNEAPGITCQIMNLPFDPEDRLIDSDADIDLATFRISEEEIEKVGKEIIRGNQSSWPPSPPEIGGGMFLAGFPQSERIAKGNRELNFGAFPVIVPASSVNDREISALLERAHAISVNGFPPPPEDFNWGGISGAPVLAFVESNIVSWRLAGVILRRHLQFNILKIARADRILPDGRLSRTLLP